MYRRRKMKKYKLGIALSALLVVVLLTTGCGKEIEVKNGSKVAVSVKGSKFTATEYYEKIKEDKISVLIDMIDHGLFDEKYKTDDEETAEIDKQVSQIRSYSGDSEETFIAIIKQYFGVETEAELREMLSLEYKRKEAVEDYLKDDLKESEIKKYYEDNITGDIQASHILITVDVDSSATDEEKEEADKKAKETAEKVIKELNNGKKFATLAKKYSKDDANASKGGDLGYFDPNDMVTEFADAVKALKVDEYTKEPVKTEYGYHVILKTGEKEKPELSEVEDKIKEKLVDQKLNENNYVYYETLKAVREKNKLSWNDDELKKAYNNYMDDLIENAKNS